MLKTPDRNHLIVVFSAALLKDFLLDWKDHFHCRVNERKEKQH